MPHPDEGIDSRVWRRKGHRLGIFVTVASFLLFAVGLMNGMSYSVAAWSEPAVGLGAIGTLFGYLLARLWYWFRAAE